MTNFSASELEAIGGARLTDGSTAASYGCVSLSWWHARVAEGVAPQPVIRRPRFTRWRLCDVLDFWTKFAANAAADKASATKVIDRARAASRKSRAPDAIARAIETRRARAAARAGRQGEA